jgi:hypothetical protein
LENKRQEESGRRYGPRYWRFWLVGCSVVIVFVLIALAVLLLSFYRTPYYRGLVECKTCIKRVGAALQRYQIKNDAYPDRLTDLVPDYIPRAALHCPADPSPRATISYKYTKQDINAPAEAILLECNHHKLRRTMPPAVIYYLKSGDVILVSPGGEVRRG